MSKKVEKVQEPVFNEMTELEQQLLAGLETAEANVTATEEPKLSAEELMMLDAATQVTPEMAQDTGAEQSQEAVPDQDGKSFADLFNAVTQEQIEQQHRELIAAFEERARYEHEKDAGNTNIQKTISKLVKGMNTAGIVQAQVVVGKGAGFVNTSESVNMRRNVYALDKLRDLLYGAVTGHVKNFVNRAVLASMVRLEGKDAVPFTGLAAKACASDKVAIDGSYKALMIRHDMAESTASTQASSTMTALEDLGVVVNSGTRAHPVYSFTKSPLAERLRELGWGITQVRA